MTEQAQSIRSPGRRRFLKHGAALGSGAATSAFIGVEALAAGKARVDMQLGWLAGNGRCRSLGSACPSGTRASAGETPGPEAGRAGHPARTMPARGADPLSGQAGHATITHAPPRLGSPAPSTPRGPDATVWAPPKNMFGASHNW